MSPKRTTAPPPPEHSRSSSSRRKGLIATENTKKQSARKRTVLDNRFHRTLLSVRVGVRRAMMTTAVIIATNLTAGSQVTATHAAIATSSPAATQIGLRVLRDGGNAIDAAIAVSFALAVLEPKSTGLGGGGFLTYFDAETGGVWTLDFREAAPGGAKRPASGPFTGAQAAAVPGFVGGLD